MARAPRSRSTDSYKTVGRTYDGVEVLAPKTRSKTFTSAEVRQAIKLALKQAGVPSTPRNTKATKSLVETDKLRVQQREDGRYEVRKPGAKRASAVMDTQKEAVARARELEPGNAPIAKRVRRSPAGKRKTWRET
ncbi:DUF2188 domain-containing protein [Methylobacterium sp. SyP6R]|uniref:DUF2188 domain-containing protein n=1 Tax=Methylobacterium sp. SyP6R TaxID=2718876 RepID=UPI001F224E92|nr:DUF2188 domain-containing protein [Methylobacterium sp. SyP6R]MCF4126055.1 DUF2188 domain-containing protein [Methylobacterium sp. SyP6R]